MDTLIERNQEVMDTLSTIGNTPMVELTRLFADPSVRVLAKLEFMNPSGSIKDRIVRHIVEDAEQRGALQPGGTIVEHTSGNTGAAAGMIGALRGYKIVLTMPEKVSHEKQCALKAYGADVITCPNDAGPKDPEHYVQRARAIAEETPGSFMLNQYDNAKNVEAHYQTTGPEIWRQCNGEIDYFVASGSTGGTISGAGGYLKSQNPNLKLVFPDPVGSVYYGYFNNHQVNEGDIDMYQVEGIGEDHLAGCMDFSLIDQMYRFRDEDAFNAARELALVEGLLCGGSSGANIWGCQQLIRSLNKPATIVTVLPDSGLKYLSKFYDDAWLDEACPQAVRVA